MPNFREVDPSYFETYQSPFSYRYASDAMRQTWSLKNHWDKAADVEIAVASAQRDAGIVTDEEYNDLVLQKKDLDVREILSRELDRSDPNFSGHDVNSFISVFSEKAPIGGRILHLGMTAEDDLSNVETLQIQESLNIVEDRLKNTLNGFAGRIEEFEDLVAVGWTHLQAAEPVTYGFRFSRYAQDLLKDLAEVRALKVQTKGKGIRGAVGTSASFEHILSDTKMNASEHDSKAMEKLGIESEEVSGQTYPRKTTLKTIAVLANIGQSCHQFASDMKLLQSSAIDEIAEPRSRNQVGSSAMPHKENPNMCEGIKALSRSLPGKYVEAWENAAEVTLERGLEDSAGKRSYLPESFLIVDEVLQRTNRVIRGLEVRKDSVARNMRTEGPFMALELVLDELPKRGANRQEMHTLLSEKAREAKSAVRRGEQNPLKKLVSSDSLINQYLSSEEVDNMFDSINHHVGDAPKRCENFLKNELYPAIEKK